MKLSKLLNDAISWISVLQCLDVKVTDNILPNTVTCPFCKADLVIYSDTYDGGQYYNCFGCNSHGNMVELYANYFKLPLSEAILKLGVQIGLNPEYLTYDVIDSYIDNYNKNTKRIQDFWTLAKEQYLKPSAEIADLKRLFNANHSLLAEDNWHSYNHSIVGAASKEDIAQFFYNTDSNKKRVPFLKGPGWKECLIVPVYGLPRKITGFIFIGREANEGNGDIVFKSVYPKTPQNIGAAFLPYSSSLTDRCDNNIIFCDDLKVVLSLHLKHLREHTKLLPIVYVPEWHSSDNIGNLSYSSQPLVWFQKDQKKGLEIAHKLDSDVSTVRISFEDVQHRYPHTTALNWLVKLRKEKKSWKSSLNEYISKHAQNDYLLTKLFQSLQLDARKIDDFLRIASDDTIVRVKELRGKGQLNKRTDFNDKVVVERNSCWIEEKSNTLISNAIIRIDTIICTESDNIYYRGVVTHSGTAHKFLERDTTIKNNPGEWLYKFLIKQGEGDFVYNSNWNKNLLNIAFLLHKPNVLNAVEKVGFHGTTERLTVNFPKWSISSGNISNFSFILNKSPKQLMPCANIPPTTLLSSRDIITLRQENEETAIGWATLCAVVANSLNALSAENPVNIVFSGKGMEDAGFSFASEFGCLSVENSKQLEKLLEHNWPIMVPKRLAQTSFSKEIQKLENKQFIFLVDELTMRAMTLQKGYHCLFSPIRCGALTEKAAASFKRALGAYLVNLCSRNFQLRTAATFYKSVEEDVFQWFKNSYQAVPFGLQQSTYKKIIHTTDQNILTNFNHLLSALIQKYGETTLKNVGLFNCKENYLWINHNLFCDFIEKLTGITPSIAFLTEILSNEGLLVEELITTGERGWWLKQDKFVVLDQSEKQSEFPIAAYTH